MNITDIVYKGFTLERILNLPVEPRAKIVEIWNNAYRNGNQLVSDSVYDKLFDTIPDYHTVKNIGFDIPDAEKRKEQLPVEMRSMEKCESTDKFLKWSELRKFSPDTEFIITPKFDGISLLIKLDPVRKVWTRGRKGDGRRSDKHFAQMVKNKKFEEPSKLSGKYVNGEAIIKFTKFPPFVKSDDNPDGYENPRSMASSMYAGDSVDENIEQLDYIVYGTNEDFADKDMMLEEFNKLNYVKVPYVKVKLKVINDEYLQDLYEKYGSEYELDGLILELNDLRLRTDMGYETNGNPKYARAWKGFKAQSADSEVLSIDFQLGKTGEFTPVANISPIRLENTTVRRATIHNAGFMMSLNCGVGSVVRVIKSGKIIPKIIGIVKPVKVQLLDHCPYCHTKLVLEDGDNLPSKHLICPNHDKCSEQIIKRMSAFLKIIEVKDISEQTVRKLYEKGYDSIEKMIHLNVDDLLKIDGFAKKSAATFIKNVRDSLLNIPLEVLQHATGLFQGLGHKTLALLNQYDSPSKIPSVSDVIAIDGFSDISANIYCDNIKRFWDYVKCLPIRIQQKQVPTGDKCKDWIVVFTQFRDKNLENLVEKEGGKIGSSVSGKTTHVFCTDPDDETGKVKSAKDKGCEIWTKEKLESYFRIDTQIKPKSVKPKSDSDSESLSDLFN